MDVSSTKPSISEFGVGSEKRRKVLTSMMKWISSYKKIPDEEISDGTLDIMIHHKSGIEMGYRPEKIDTSNPISLMSYLEETDFTLSDPWINETVEWTLLGGPEKFNCTVFDLLELPPEDKLFCKAALEKLRKIDEEQMERAKAEQSETQGYLAKLMKSINRKKK